MLLKYILSDNFYRVLRRFKFLFQKIKRHNLNASSNFYPFDTKESVKKVTAVYFEGFFIEDLCCPHKDTEDETKSKTSKT